MSFFPLTSLKDKTPFQPNLPFRPNPINEEESPEKKTNSVASTAMQPTSIAIDLSDKAAPRIKEIPSVNKSNKTDSAPAKITKKTKEKSIEKPIEQTTKKATETTSEKTTKKTDSTAEKTIEQTTKKTAEKTIDKTIDKTEQISIQKFSKVSIKLDDLRSFLFIGEMYENVFKRQNPKISQNSQFEYYNTVDELNDFIEQHKDEPTLSKASIDELVNLLAQRWDRIKNSNTSYTQETKHPANIICTQIAQEISKYTGIPVFKILMPTITTIENNITLTNLADENLKITDFVLSDDNHNFIEVIPALEYFSRFGEFRLNHVDVNNNVHRLLSQEEVQRVVNHSIETQAFHERALQLRAAKGNPHTIGYALTQLGIALHKASIAQDGEEFEASPDADIAIFTFLEIFEKLDKDIKSQMKKWEWETIHNKIISFSEIMKLIARDKKVRATNARLCVLDISGYIFSMLDQHPQLYNINYHSSRPISSHFSEIEQYYEEALKNLKKPITNISSHAYPDENEEKMVSKILRSNKHFWTIFGKKIKFYSFFSRLNDANKTIAVKRLLRRPSGVEFLIGQTKDFDTLHKLLKSIPDFLRMNVLKSTELLNKFYDKANAKGKKEYFSNLSSLLDLTEYKRHLLDCLRADILQQYQSRPAIKIIMSNEEDSIVSDTESAEENELEIDEKENNQSDEPDVLVIDLASSEKSDASRDNEKESLENEKEQSEKELITLQKELASSLVEFSQGTLNVQAESVKRTGIKSSSLNKEEIERLLNIPAEFMLGTAVDDGDCFFDALRITLNPPNEEFYSVTTLRQNCFNYYKDNKKEVEKLEGKDHTKHYFETIKKTASEMNRRGKAPIWGRSNVEAVMLCRELGLPGIFIVELFNPENQGYVPGYYLATADGYKQSTMPLSEALDRYPVLIVVQNDLHFTPIVRRPKISATSIQTTEKNTEEKEYAMDIDEPPVPKITPRPMQKIIQRQPQSIMEIIPSPSHSYLPTPEERVKKRNFEAAELVRSPARVIPPATVTTVEEGPAKKRPRIQPVSASVGNEAVSASKGTKSLHNEESSTSIDKSNAGNSQHSEKTSSATEERGKKRSFDEAILETSSSAPIVPPAVTNSQSIVSSKASTTITEMGPPPKRIPMGPPPKRPRNNTELPKEATNDASKVEEPKKVDHQDYREYLRKAEEEIKIGHPLEAFHYLKKAYEFLRKKGFGLERSQFQKEEQYDWVRRESKLIQSIAIQAMRLLPTLSPEMMEHYKKQTQEYILYWSQCVNIIANRFLNRELTESENDIISNIIIQSRQK